MRTRLQTNQRVSGTLLLLGCAAILATAVATGAAPVTTPQPTPRPTPPAVGANNFNATRLPVAMAPKSRIPLPADAELWVDSEGTPMLNIPGVPADGVGKVQVVVYHPRGDRLAWAEFTAFYATQGLLSTSVKPLEALFSPLAQGPLTEANSNIEEIKVFNTTANGSFLVLGSINNTLTKSMLAYVVVVSGKLNNAQAMFAARGLVSGLTAQERSRRSVAAPPVPPGAAPGGSVARLQGPQLQQLLESILAGPHPARVKDMARVVLPQATAVVLSSVQMSSPLSTEQFVSFYIQQATKLGWGPPVSTDTSQPDSPTMLFQLPYNQGVAMIRSITSTAAGPAGPASRKTQTLVALMVEGKINVSALKPAAAPAPAGRN